MLKNSIAFDGTRSAISLVDGIPNAASHKRDGGINGAVTEKLRLIK